MKAWARGTAVLVGVVAALAAVRSEAPRSAASIEPETLARVRNHLEHIAGVPHPIGSEAHTQVLDYLQAQLSAAGLTPELLEGVDSTSRPSGVRAIRVQNVFARIRGTASTGAIVFSAHYDSAPTSNGAGDDGAAVAMMLDLARTLKQGPAPTNDLIFLFTDAEEINLSGSHVFATHPLAATAKVVVNFDARGSRGSLFMFESTGSSGALVGLWARATSHPVGSSVAPAVYQWMPNSTDFTELGSMPGVLGLNFAFIDGYDRNHNAGDVLDGLSNDTLAELVVTARELAAALGHQDLNQLKGSPVTYFNFFGWVVVVPEIAIRLFSYLCFALAVLLTGFLVARKAVTLKGVALGGLTHLLAVIAGIATVLLLQLALVTLWPPFRESTPNLISYAQGVLLGFTIVALAVGALIRHALGSKRTLNDAVLGITLVWAGLGAMLSTVAPGAEYLFCVSAFAGLVAVLLFRSARTTPAGAVLGIGVLAVLMGNLVHTFALALGVEGAVIFCAVALLALDYGLSFVGGLGLPPWRSLAAAAVGLVILGGSIGASLVDHDYRRMDWQAYWLDQDANRGRRLFSNPHDAALPKPEEVPGRVLMTSRGLSWGGAWEERPQLAPRVEAVRTESPNGSVVRITFAASERLRAAVAVEGAAVSVVAIKVLGRVERGPWSQPSIELWAPDPREPVIFELTLDSATAPIVIRTVDQRRGPLNVMAQMPEGVLASPHFRDFGSSESTFITSRLEL